MSPSHCWRLASLAFVLGSSAYPALAADWPAGYSKCADEGGTCAVGASPRSVSFGIRNQWVTKTVSGQVACTVAAFGMDPDPDSTKKCAVAKASTAPAPSPAPSPSPAPAPAPAPSTAVVTQWGTVGEPPLPSTVCARLPAMLTATNGSVDALDASPSVSEPDQTRIQQAINACPAGQAVKLVTGSSGENGFLSGPLTLKSGVQLWIDAGVTLFVSRNPADFDNGPGTCGTATAADPHACTALIVATSTVGSGIVGAGTIDGRGGSLLTSGPNARRRTWWDVAYQNKTSGLNQQNPRLVQVNKGSNFTLHGITLQNSPNFHIVTSGVTGVTAWGIKILSPSLVYTKKNYACPAGTTPDAVTPASCFTPDTVKNTDGFDPGQSSKVLLAWSYISTGDDDVAVKAGGSPSSSQLTFAHNHFYYGHGLSIGSETDAGLSGMAVTDLSIDGFDSPNGNGLRIKSDSSRGGKVQDVSYSHVCMRNVRSPLVFDPFYSASAGKLYPSFTGIRLSAVHDLGSAKYGGGLVTFSGYERNGTDNPLVIALDNVVFDGAQPTFEAGHNGGPSALPASTHFTFGPGTVSFASEIQASVSKDVTVTGTSGASTAVDCTNAFVPLNSVLANSPI